MAPSFLPLSTIITVLAFGLASQSAAVSAVRGGTGVSEEIDLDEPSARVKPILLMRLMEYPVAFAVMVDNWSRHAFTHPVVRQGGPGHNRLLIRPPKKIPAGHRDGFIVRQKEGTDTGTSGTVSWKLGTTGHHIVVLWEVHNNTRATPFRFAMGLSTQTARVPKDDAWFREMSGQRWRLDVHYKGRTSYPDSSDLFFRADDFYFAGEMLNVDSGRAMLTVDIRPARDEDEAPSITEKIRKYNEKVRNG